MSAVLFEEMCKTLFYRFLTVPCVYVSPLIAFQSNLGLLVRPVEAEALLTARILLRERPGAEKLMDDQVYLSHSAMNYNATEWRKLSALKICALPNLRQFPYRGNEQLYLRQADFI